MEPFKNLFSPDLVRVFGFHLDRHLNDFDRNVFEDPIIRKLPDLELKERSQLIADKLHEVLPSDFGARRSVLLAMLHPDETGFADEGSNEDGICGWGVMPMAELVGQHHLDPFEEALDLLKEMTKRSSSEFAIRYFLMADSDRALSVIRSWVSDPNQHVRRLISEGTRPRLPWGMQLTSFVQDPTPILPLLTELRDDSEEYVRRSVANNLNDIAKDHPDLVAELAQQWMKDANLNRKRLVKHACRTLIKAGHPGALSAIGIQPPEVKLVSLDVSTPTVTMGGKLEFTVELQSTAESAQDLLIDYLLHFKKANGNLSPKVFKWTRTKISAAAAVKLNKSHSIKPITTRVYYVGEQRISLRINGQDFGDEQFLLVDC